MICLVALRSVSFSLKFGPVVKSILSKSNVTKFCGVIPACTGRNWSSGFYGACANTHPGKQESCFSREHDTQLISLPLLQQIFSGGLSNSILFKNPVPDLEYLCHQKAMPLFYLFISSNSLGKWSFVFPSHLFPSATVKKIYFFRVFRKLTFFPGNSEQRNVLWQRKSWQGHACQHVSWPRVGDPPPLPAWRFPGCNLRAHSVCFGCVKPL